MLFAGAHPALVQRNARRSLRQPWGSRYIVFVRGLRPVRAGSHPRRMECLSRGHTGPVRSRPREQPVTTTCTRRWRLAAAGFAIAATSFTTAACGSDVMDDGVEQEVREEIDEPDQDDGEGEGG
jgi:hypothetical protein